MPSVKRWMTFAMRPDLARFVLRSAPGQGPAREGFDAARVHARIKRSRPHAGRLLGALSLAVLLGLADHHALAEERVVVQGLADAEEWNTTSQSAYLSVNEGDRASLGRLRLWAVGEFAPGLQGFALGALEGGSATDNGGTDTKLEQAYLRYSFSAPTRLVIQAGRLSLPYGNFSRRYFSNQNPLIGAPENYFISYPLGLQISGAVKRFDFMVAALDGPLSHQEYDSPTESILRPALAAGVTVMTGFRLGVYATQGPYLSRISEGWLLPGVELKDLDERVAGLDVQFSRAHFELNGELTRSRLEVPNAGDATGQVWYVEPKVTFSPRWYGALRWERGEAPFPHWIWATRWAPGQMRINDVEAGAGFRITPDFLVKASYRAEMGKDSAAPEGRAVAVQFSYRFDVNAWIQRPR